MKPSKRIELGNRIAGGVVPALGEQLCTTEYLVTGSTSSVFRVTTDRSNYILRIATPRFGKSPSYESDFALRSALWKAGQPVAKPLATDQSIDIEESVRWAIDEFVPGDHPVRGEISSEISRQLGSLLRTLHGLTAIGYGKLGDTRQRLQGISDTPDEGMLTRLESPWPFTPNRLAEHPSMRLQPSLVEKLLPLESSLTSFVSESSPAVIHSDLHEGQLLISGGKLTALLDFNDAVIGRPEWDFGSYLYFHGKCCLRNLLDGYTDAPEEKAELSDRAVLSSVLIALHHGNRGFILKRPHRIEASARFLQSQLR